MCGIVGFLGGRWSADLSPIRTIRMMADAIAHRGPDCAGSWCDQTRRLAFGHRRLSIQDLSEAGHQPMLSHSGRYVIVFNGEIYNQRELRVQLERSGQAPRWRGSSDTETLVACFDAWDIQTTVQRCAGMFAFAVWDRMTSTLMLARDRLGEKPLYYGWQGQGDSTTFLFGSELKAVRAHPAFEGKINRGALSLQLRHGCVPAPYSIYDGIFKLESGCLLSISLDAREPKVWPYWSAVATVENGIAQRFTGTPEQAVDQLEALLRKSVSQCMISDVPLGAFLSGGIDSSTIVALMQAQSARPVRTFTIGFHEPGYDEATLAKAVARHLGTDHTQLYVTADQAMGVIERLPTFYDEPFSDVSQIPTILVAQLARQHVTVSLSGDAGDELFCGYTRYQRSARIWNKMSHVPAPLRRLAMKGVAAVSPNVWNSMADAVRPMLPASLHKANIGDKMHKAAAIISSDSFDELYLRMMSQWDNPARTVIAGFEPSTLLTDNAPAFNGVSGMQRMMALDMITYLPDDILTKVDRAAMGVSLETRMPFLDHRVVEFAWRVPQSMKIRDGESKWILRQVLHRHVPRRLVERPKMGFGVPIGHWLRGHLREWAETLLDPARLRREGYFDPAIVRLKWKQHLSSEHNWQGQLWNVLMFQSWLENQQTQTNSAHSTNEDTDDARQIL
ncbi:asparagine synthase (glutamine-hydrolyzing) [Paraburkholderia metrosideri]|uniref:asparagine synthase (glutamine-hydrolyzing) n=1 Tax=Paraburkholderia metrosideri TaxID=580937 RepID=A0ABM8NGZ7_9BURK|nr:asparagine synthase (glutamine-hydrolyzing) [Paraburkholderia metrosideri]CAD6524742.1 Putative asparagine synthetase [glutamine-hydrolyzing] [Paraburkholderia metrosideri]